MKIHFVTIMIMVLLLTVVASASEDHGHEDKHQHEHGHEHHAPRGGTLVVFGDEFAHTELLLDPEKGELKVYVLDGEAEKPVRISQQEIIIDISPKEGAEWSEQTLVLKPVSNVLTGEKEGDTSEFTVQSDVLTNAKEFNAEIKEIEIKGIEFKEVKFDYPEGNE